MIWRDYQNNWTNDGRHLSFVPFLNKMLNICHLSLKIIKVAMLIMLPVVLSFVNIFLLNCTCLDCVYKKDVLYLPLSAGLRLPSATIS